MHFPLSYVPGARCLSTLSSISPESSISSASEQTAFRGPYGNSSIASSAASSTSSVFSYAGSESSCASSVDYEYNPKESSPVGSWPKSAQTDTYSQHLKATHAAEYGVSHAAQVQHKAIHAQSLPVHELRNTRRSSRLVPLQTGAPGYGSLVSIDQAKDLPVRPPTLLRETERKGNFVDCLVDTSAQMIEAIWPITSERCGLKSPYNSVLPLRTFIQETLRRSRTSFSTLQVALYYLVLIRPFVQEACRSLDVDSSSKTLQCGRRTFLAALILASKYLQDRNYSTRAWSKISGLPTSEINTNEMAFLAVIDWKLHISETIFDKWTKLIIKHTPSSPASLQLLDRKSTWQELVLRLTPALLEQGEFDEVICKKGPCAPRSSMPACAPLPDSLAPLSCGGGDKLRNPFAIPYTAPPRSCQDSRQFEQTPAACLSERREQHIPTAMSSTIRNIEGKHAMDNIPFSQSSISIQARGMPIARTYDCRRKSSMSICTNTASDSDSSDSSDSPEAAAIFDGPDNSDSSEYTPYCTSAEQSPSSVLSEYLSDSSESSCQSPVEVASFHEDPVGKPAVLVISGSADYSKADQNYLTPTLNSNDRKRSYSHVTRGSLDRTQSCPLEASVAKPHRIAVRPTLKTWYSESVQQQQAAPTWRRSPTMARKKIRCAAEDVSSFERTPSTLVMSQ